MGKTNIFLAMGFEPEDAMIHALRADLADAIANFLTDKKLKQKDSAALLGLPQATVSHIVHGRIDHLSVERLMRAMVRAGIPGYAEWPTADTARAGVIARSGASVVTHSSELRIFGEYDVFSDPSILTIHPDSVRLHG